MAFHLSWNASDVFKTEMMLNKCKFEDNNGDTAIRLCKPNNGSLCKDEDMNESLNMKGQHQQAELKKGGMSIGIFFSEIVGNKRNGIEFLNVDEGFKMKGCEVKNNKFSGIYIDHLIPEDKNYSFCNCM